MSKIKIEKNFHSKEPPRKKERGGSSFVATSQQDFDIQSRFGKNLKLYREKVGLTQVELAKKVPMDRAYLAEVELGKRRISLSLAYRITKALNISINDLIS